MIIRTRNKFWNTDINENKSVASAFRFDIVLSISRY